MPVCILTCEASYSSVDDWNISIFGLEVTQAEELKSRHPELNIVSSDILTVDAMPNLDANSTHFEFQQRVKDTFSVMKDKPEAILSLAATYINALADLKYVVINTTAVSIGGLNKWTYALQM
ncbi:uncharacterized protein LOC110861982 [Folsomia candida]|uniref:Uncharacterized protein n=1 Tax=Folsomia candida TaxID=158441 RepID=A0A226D0U0_FOLCA|nr:uncharacterized protein LOC110861982 [Folsomia candida]OXA38271.1 hypothetical protein Fcan01_26959 [Folsomia candida]